ncbi:MAG: lysine--tRNA ligase [Planctomycetes bacterium]|nr:lysine--tRNA ligase [Planctomycetota bacterium]
MTKDIAPDRLPKLDRLRELGIDPYPARVPSPEPVASLLAGLDARLGQRVVAGGRLTQLRDFGKLRFSHLLDRSGSIQIGFARDRLPDFWPNRKLIEANDQVVVVGELARTQKGEPTIWAEQVVLAAKALRHPAEKWAGLQNVEQRYRMRYVDLYANPDVRTVFEQRSRIVRETRAYFDSLGYLEVETPILHPISGGAAARPFSTHHNALDMPLFLRIAPELYLKRLLVGGLERVYEIGRVFRNEGVSTRHNPEFTMLESYEAWADYRTIMERVEGLFAHLCERVLGGRTKVTFRGLEVDLRPPFPRRRYLELFAEHNGGLDWFDADGVLARARQLGLSVDGLPAAKIAGDVFEATVEPHLAGPVFVHDYPTAISPLAKTSPEDPRVAERFEIFIASCEFGNAFSELNDPLDQEQRFVEQLEHRDEESPSALDVDYVTALEFGMPPAGGLGIGIDRLTMLLAGADSIRDVLLFPLLRRLEPGAIPPPGDDAAAAAEEQAT